MPRALSISKLVLSTRSVGGALICWGGLSAFSAATLSIGPIRFLLPVLHSVGKTRVSWCTGSGVPGRVRVRAQTGRRVRLPGAQLRQDHSRHLQLEARLSRASHGPQPGSQHRVKARRNAVNFQQARANKDLSPFLIMPFSVFDRVASLARVDCPGGPIFD